MEYKELTGVSPEILRAVEAMGFTTMTEVQEKAIPVMMAGKEIIAKAPTGTGKTCAFGIPLVDRAQTEGAPWVQSLVLCPTRELCTQIVDELRNLSRFKSGVRIAAVYGGQPMKPQIEALKKNPQIVVATPGRLLDHMQHRTIRVDKVTTVVLDEADEMLDMGFFKDVRRILDSLKSKKQMVMFSATISREVMDIGWLYQRDAEEITVRPVEESRPKITQYCCCTTGRKKFEDLLAVLREKDLGRVLIFCNTKYTTALICDMLTRRGVPAQCIHGDMIQKDRNRVMARFKEGEIPVMVATDVAARGIDVTDIDAVINYDFPQDNETYVHRIGRTARAGKEGISYLFYAPDERMRLKNLIRYTRFEISPISVSEEGVISPVEEL
jgi:ATP-dependent RNA helicase DeaD